MNYKLLVPALFASLLLGACSPQENQGQSEIQSEVEELPQSKVVELPQTEEGESQPSLNKVIDEKNIHLAGGPDKSYYDNGTYLTLGESFAVGNSEELYGEISLDSFELIEDSNGSGRQALLLWFTETNITDDDIEVGLYGTQSMGSPHVFYEDLNLKRLSHYQPDTKFFDPEYIDNIHVQYGDENETKPQSCAFTTTLKPNESRTCFSHYSYAGKGRYLVSQLLDGAENPTPVNAKTYLVEVK